MSRRLLLYGFRPALQERFKRVLQDQSYDLEFASGDGPVPVEKQRSGMDAVLVHARKRGEGEPELESSLLDLLPADNLFLVGSLVEFSRMDISIWHKVEGVILLGGAEENLLSVLEDLFQSTGEDHPPTVLSLLRMMINQARDWIGAGEGDVFVKLTLNMLKAAFQCSYAGASVYRRAEEVGYHVSYSMGRSAPLYPSQDLLEPGIVHAGEHGQGLIGGIQKGENLSSMIWSPIPDEGSPGSFFVLGKEEGSFQREDLERLIMFTGYAARVIQYIRLRLGRQREKEVLSREHQAAVKSEKISSISRLMTSVAHLLNNPLQAIQINLELASREDVKGQKQAHYLNVVGEEVERLRGIVADMVNHYRPGQRERTWVSLHDVIREALTLKRAEMEKRGIQVNLHLAQDLPPLWGLPHQLRQVFIHLIDNAMDAMPQGGVLTIETELQKDLIACMIRDTGKGIPEKHEDQIFDPFYSTKDNCHGLGLTVCDNIITQHHGDIELLNTNQEGTSFLITLPIGGQA